MKSSLNLNGLLDFCGQYLEQTQTIQSVCETAPQTSTMEKFYKDFTVCR